MHARSLILWGWILGIMVASPPALAGPNANTTFVLHAVPTQFGPCDIPDPCALASGPSVEITHPGQPYAIYFIVRNYAEISGFQADLVWPADWTWLFEESCPVAVLDCFHVGPHTILCAFNCITGGATAVMAVMHMVPGSGCFEIVESAWPGGTNVMDCQSQQEAIPKSNWGRVCVGPGGINTCGGPVPVVDGTWGAIRSQYSGF
jgi:hypothetical protein